MFVLLRTGWVGGGGTGLRLTAGAGKVYGVICASGKDGPANAEKELRLVDGGQTEGGAVNRGNCLA